MTTFTHHRIKEDETGEHDVEFPCEPKKLIPPSNYQERMAWIRSSYDAFNAQVQEKYSLRQLCNKG